MTRRSLPWVNSTAYKHHLEINDIMTYGGLDVGPNRQDLYRQAGR